MRLLVLQTSLLAAGVPSVAFADVDADVERERHMVESIARAAESNVRDASRSRRSANAVRETEPGVAVDELVSAAQSERRARDGFREAAARAHVLPSEWGRPRPEVTLSRRADRAGERATETYVDATRLLAATSVDSNERGYTAAMMTRARITAAPGLRHLQLARTAAQLHGFSARAEAARDDYHSAPESREAEANELDQVAIAEARLGNRQGAMEAHLLAGARRGDAATLRTLRFVEDAGLQPTNLHREGGVLVRREELSPERTRALHASAAVSYERAGELARRLHDNPTARIAFRAARRHLTLANGSADDLRRVERAARRVAPQLLRGR